MSAELVIRTLEELKAFLNENGMLEIVIRGQKKKIKDFQKVIIDIAQKGQEKEVADKVIQALNKNNILNDKNIRLLDSITQVPQLGFLLNGFNLCATCAGFAMMYAKLDNMSAEINRQISQARKEMKDINDLHADYEFNKVLSEHSDMLDCEKKQQPYSEDKLRQLVDAEYNVLTLLISTLQKDVAGDHKALVFSIYSMLAMLTVSLRKFDETYYFNNQKALSSQDPWHLSHGKWMSVYEKLSSDWCVEKLQDIATFDMDLTTDQVDAYYHTMLDQTADLKEEVEDNQALILAFGTPEALTDYRRLSSKEVTETVEKAIRESGADLTNPAIAQTFRNALQQAAIA